MHVFKNEFQIIILDFFFFFASRFNLLLVGRYNYQELITKTLCLRFNITFFFSFCLISLDETENIVKSECKINTGKMIFMKTPFYLLSFFPVSRFY